MNITISRASALRAASHLGLAWRDVANSANDGLYPARAWSAVYERAVSRISGVSLRDTFTDELSSTREPQLLHVAETLPGVGSDETATP